jgi:hypothetical protein
MSQREKDRQVVLNAVRSSICAGMDSGSVSTYIVLANDYGQRYGIDVESWWMNGRGTFSSVEYAWEWAQTLP